MLVQGAQGMKHLLGLYGAAATVVVAGVADLGEEAECALFGSLVGWASG